MLTVFAFLIIIISVKNKANTVKPSPRTLHDPTLGNRKGKEWWPMEQIIFAMIILLLLIVVLKEK